MKISVVVLVRILISGHNSNTNVWCDLSHINSCELMHY